MNVSFCHLAAIDRRSINVLTAYTDVDSKELRITLNYLQLASANSRNDYVFSAALFPLPLRHCINGVRKLYVRLYGHWGLN